MNLPIDFQNQMKELLGEAYDAFEKEYDKPYFSALRANTNKISPVTLRNLIKKTENDNLGENVPWEMRGIYYNEDIGFRPGKSPFHEAGLYYIQEPSAMLPVSLLDIPSKYDDGTDDESDNDTKTDECITAKSLKILDLCAAPGGKTTQIADYMQGRGLLIANEIIPSRAKILSENIERMGVKNAIVISADPRDISDRFTGFFDRILVDAPCSGEGMFRKHPEAMDEWSLENVEVCASRQSWVMDCAANMLKHGGRMVYSTCTFNSKEDEKSVEDFLQRHPEFELLEGGMHRVYPHLQKGEGHFGAVLIKGGNNNIEERASKRDKKIKANAIFSTFMEECLSDKGIEKINFYAKEGKYIMFGDNLYLAPCDTPNLSGLKVLRPGLHLGTIIKDRFEPSHALALHLKPDDVLRVCDFSKDDAVKYLKGEAMHGICVYRGAEIMSTAERPDDDSYNPEPLQGKKSCGWSLVTVCGYSLGWGKNANGILKNHYPKGLRWN